MPMCRKALFQLALLVFFVVAASACNKGDDDDSSVSDDDDSADEQASVTAVRVKAVEKGRISESIKAASTIRADKRADVVLEVSGTVLELRAEEGDQVKSGQVLAVLKSPQVSAELERSAANFTKASEDFASVQGLFEQGFVARRDLDEARLAHETARATVDQAREAEASRRVKSPITGTVSLRDIRFGEAVSPPKIAFQIVDLRALLVDVHLPEKDLARLRVGQEVRVLSELLEEGKAAGEVLRISPVIDASTGTVKVTIAIAREEQRVLPGMFVQVEIVVATHEDALLIPKVALVYDEGKSTVFRVEDGKAVRRLVRRGFAGAEQVEVLEGLAAGDEIVTAGQGLLQDGASVRVVP
jgi:membrane fusion protein, multidrug efflux system